MAHKAVFFDMDGVLYDSMPNHEFSWCKAFQQIGLDFAPEEAYANEGRTAKGTINIVFQRNYGRDATDEEVEAIYAAKSALMKSRPAPRILPRMDSLLRSLDDMGVAVFVVTGSRQPSLITRLADSFGLRQGRLVSGADVTKGKPDPEPYLIALHRSGFAPDECSVVENAPMGVIAGKAAGLLTIAVNTGKLPDKALTEAGADILFHDTTALAKHLVASVARE